MKFPLAIIFLLFSTALLAQNTRQQSYWMRLYFRANLPHRFALHYEVDERRLIQPDRQLQFISHLHLRKSLAKSLELAAGMSYSRVNGLSEWRPFQEVLLSRNFQKKWQGSLRLRMDERYQQTEDNWEWRCRLRIRLQANYKLNERWILKANDEFMWQDDHFDQNRVYLAAEYLPGKHFSAEIGYMKLLQSSSNGGYFDRDILRTTLYVNL